MSSESIKKQASHQKDGSEIPVLWDCTYCVVLNGSNEPNWNKNESTRCRGTTRVIILHFGTIVTRVIGPEMETTIYNE